MFELITSAVRKTNVIKNLDNSGPEAENTLPKTTSTPLKTKATSSKNTPVISRNTCPLATTTSPKLWEVYRLPNLLLSLKLNINLKNSDTKPGSEFSSFEEIITTREKPIKRRGQREVDILPPNTLKPFML